MFGPAPPLIVVALAASVVTLARNLITENTNKKTFLLRNMKKTRNALFTCNSALKLANSFSNVSI